MFRNLPKNLTIWCWYIIVIICFPNWLLLFTSVHSKVQKINVEIAEEGTQIGKVFFKILLQFIMVVGSVAISPSPFIIGQVAATLSQATALQAFIRPLRIQGVNKQKLQFLEFFCPNSKYSFRMLALGLHIHSDDWKWIYSFK